jgi:hypothetical protein
VIILIAIGNPATGPMCPQIKSPLLGSIFLPDLVSIADDTYRRLPFRAVARIRGGPRIPRAAGCTGTSEQTWSKHRCEQV